MRIYTADGIAVTSVPLSIAAYGVAVDADGIAYLTAPTVTPSSQSIPPVLYSAESTPPHGHPVSTSDQTAALRSRRIPTRRRCSRSGNINEPPPVGEYGTVDLNDMTYLTGGTVTADGIVYLIGNGSLDFDEDGSTTTAASRSAPSMWRIRPSLRWSY
jgi:hypothetical protein